MEVTTMTNTRGSHSVMYTKAPKVIQTEPPTTQQPQVTIPSERMTVVPTDDVIVGPIDGCTPGNNDCDANAACIDSDGSYECACKIGFKGDGLFCEGNHCISRFRAVFACP